MQFVIPSNNVLLERKEIYINHKGKELAFSVNTFTRSAFESYQEKPFLFTHINSYIETLDETSQDNIFYIYECILNIFDTVADLNTAKLQLIDLVAKLYQYFDFDRIYQWTKYHCKDIKLPTKDIKTFYTDKEERNHTQYKTYLLSDYEDLIALITQLRIMIPIWGEYIRNFSNAIGTIFKEFSAYELLVHSGVLQNRAMIKLETYVRVITPTEGQREAIVEFISSEDYPLWNLALMVIRKVCLLDVRGRYENTPILISYIYTHINEKLKHSSNSFDGQIRDKEESNSSEQSEEHQVSKFEAIKTKEIISAGDRVFIERMANDPNQLALQLDPDCPDGLAYFFKKILVNTTIPLAPFTEIQNILIKQVCAPVLPHKGIDYLDEEKLNCAAAAQAVLWRNGHLLLAGIISANKATEQKSNITTTGVESKTKTQPELKEQLLKLFPFTRKTKFGKELDVVSANIDYIVKELSNHMWILRLPAEMIQLVNVHQPNRVKLAIPSNIKNIVMEYAIYLASREIKV